MEQAVRANAAQSIGPTRMVYYSGTDQILNGYLLCYDHDNATVAERRNTVEKPSYNNIMANAFAGVVVSPPRAEAVGAYGPGWCEIALPSNGFTYLPIYTDVNVTAGDMLGPRADSYKAGKAVMGNPIARAMEAVDRSVTNGTVYCDCRYFNWDDNQVKFSRHFDHFRTPNVPGVVAGALASHAYHLAGTTAMAIAPLAAAAETVINITEGVGELALLGTTTTIAQMSMMGGQYLMAAGQELFCRQRVKIDNIADEDWFWGFGTPPTQSGGVLTTVAQLTSAGTTPAATDYLGVFFDATANAGVPNINVRKASGTEQTAALTGALLVNNTYAEIAILARNRLAGTTAGYKTVYVWVDGVLCRSFETAALAAAFPDTVPLAWSMAGITGACCCTIDFLEINHHR